MDGDAGRPARAARRPAGCRRRRRRGRAQAAERAAAGAEDGRARGSDAGRAAAHGLGPHQGARRRHGPGRQGSRRDPQRVHRPPDGHARGGRQPAGRRARAARADGAVRRREPADDARHGAGNLRQGQGRHRQHVAAKGAKAWLDTIEAMRQRFNAAGGDVRQARLRLPPAAARPGPRCCRPAPTSGPRPRCRAWTARATSRRTARRWPTPRCSASCAGPGRRSPPTAPTRRCPASSRAPARGPTAATTRARSTSRAAMPTSTYHGRVRRRLDVRRDGQPHRRDGARHRAGGALRPEPGRADAAAARHRGARRPGREAGIRHAARELLGCAGRHRRHAGIAAAGADRARHPQHRDLRQAAGRGAVVADRPRHLLRDDAATTGCRTGRAWPTSGARSRATRATF